MKKITKTKQPSKKQSKSAKKLKPKKLTSESPSYKSLITENLDVSKQEQDELEKLYDTLFLPKYRPKEQSPDSKIRTSRKWQPKNYSLDDSAEKIDVIEVDSSEVLNGPFVGSE